MPRPSEPETWSPIYSIRLTREIHSALDRKAEKFGWTKGWLISEILGRVLKLPKECWHGVNSAHKRPKRDPEPDAHKVYRRKA